MHRFFSKFVLTALTFASSYSLTQVSVRAQFPAQQQLYISNFYSRTISTVQPGGGTAVPFVAGTAMLTFPDGMAFDAAGNLYVTVLYPTFGGVTRVTPDGTTTLYATCDASNTNVYNPTGMVIDRAGNLFVANQDKGTISKVSPNGSKDRGGALYGTLYASGGGINMPDGLALDSAGNLYVANLDNTISKITPNADGTTGTPSLWVSENGLAQPSGLAFDPAGNLFVSNGNNTILRIAPQPHGAPVVSIHANNRNGTLRAPSGIAFDAAGNLYVANSGNSTISKITPDGADSVFASGGSLATPAYVMFPVAPNTPAAPTVSGISDDTGVSGDFITKNPRLVLSGTAEPAGTVRVYVNGSPIGSTVANASTGQWTFDYSSVVLPDGGYLFTASTQNPSSGNVSAASVPLLVTVDTTPPAVTISAPVVQFGSGGSGDTMVFGITYAGADSVNLTPDKITLYPTGSAAAASVTISGSGTGSRAVTLAGLSGSGTLAIAVLTGTAADVAGNLAPATAPSAAATVPDAFADWAAAQGLSGAGAGWNADPDGNGIANGVEYALGRNPGATFPVSSLPTARRNGARLELTYHKARSEVLYQVQSSTDLRNWTTTDVDQGGSGSDVTASAPVPTTGGKFLRLQVTRP